MNQLMICLGILGALCINVVLPVTDWRLMFQLAAVPAAILLLGEAPVVRVIRNCAVTVEVTTTPDRSIALG